MNEKDKTADNTLIWKCHLVARGEADRTHYSNLHFERKKNGKTGYLTLDFWYSGPGLCFGLCWSSHGRELCYQTELLQGSRKPVDLANAFLGHILLRWQARWNRILFPCLEDFSYGTQMQWCSPAGGGREPSLGIAYCKEESPRIKHSDTELHLLWLLEQTKCPNGTKK